MILYWAISMLVRMDLSIIMAFVIVGMVMMSLMLLMDMQVDYNENQIIF